MKDEIDAMERTQTWTIVPLPSGHHAIGSKWVYRVKYKNDETLRRYKARLAAKGYNQQKDRDFMDTSTPVAKIMIVKVFIDISY